MTISEENYVLELAGEYKIEWGKSVPLGIGVGVRLGEFDVDEEEFWVDLGRQDDTNGSST